ncbi:squamosa promoter-binding 9 [Micractinium conductrix]|uniref:Squamosa promoter-binding 9 n=1 Tax=Micractinium conductrix TaxID=554055 RepID=A0A2P6VC95_9CHLO|nr:squamosa promoter-binding 9 [Micractinium conductrix]|eukprot:PSC71709.1 squamosa promoter-binding 9 [Micractinium conductrix]
MSARVQATAGGGSPPPRRRCGGRRAATSVLCQVADCGAELVGTGGFYRRYRVCKSHSQSPSLLVAGIQQRFCQQCARFHPIEDFEPERRSCKAALERHRSKRRSSGRSGGRSSGSLRKRPRRAAAPAAPHGSVAPSGACSASRETQQAFIDVDVEMVEVVEVVEVAPAVPAAAAAAAALQPWWQDSHHSGGGGGKEDSPQDVLLRAVEAFLGSSGASSGEACCQQSAGTPSARRPSPATTSCDPDQTHAAETSASQPSATPSLLLDLMDSCSGGGSTRGAPPSTAPAAAPMPLSPQTPPAPSAFSALPAASAPAWPQAAHPPALAAPPAVPVVSAPPAPVPAPPPAAAGCASWAAATSPPLASGPLLCEQFSSSHPALLHPQPAVAPLCVPTFWPPVPPAAGPRAQVAQWLPLPTFMPICETGGSTSAGISPFQNAVGWGSSYTASAGGQPPLSLAPVPTAADARTEEASMEGWTSGALLAPEPQPHAAAPWWGLY